VAEPFSKWKGTSARQKIYGKFLWIKLPIVTSQTMQCDVINFVNMFKQFYAMFYKPSTTLRSIYLRYTGLST